MIKQMHNNINKENISGIQAFKGAVAQVQKYSAQDIVLALMGRKKISPKQWLEILQQEIKQKLPKNELQALTGKRFSEIARKFSIKFGIEINSPAELIVALRIHSDRLGNLSTKSSIPGFAEILGKGSIKQAIAKANILMEGQRPFSEKAYLLSVYLAADMKTGERLSDYLKGESVDTLGQAAKYSKLNFYSLSKALIHAKENGESLDKAIVFVRYLEDHPEKKTNSVKAYQEIESLLAKEVKGISKELADKPTLSPEQLYVHHLQYTQTINEQKLNFGGAKNVKDTMDEIYSRTEKINKKLINKAKKATKERDKKIVQAYIETKVAKAEGQEIGMLKKKNTSEIVIKDVRKQAYLEKQRQKLLKLSPGAAGIYLSC